MSEETFGRQFAGAATLTAALALESTAQRQDPFVRIDDLLDGLLARFLGGEKLLEVESTDDRSQSLRIIDLSAADRQIVEDTYRLDKVEGRGAWFVPEELSIDVGVLQFPLHFYEAPRFARWRIADDHAQVSTRICPDAVAAWALLEPSTRAIYRPLERSSFFSTPKVLAEHRETWPADRALLEWLGFPMTSLDPEEPLVVQPASDQMAKRTAIVSALSSVVGEPMAARFRVVKLLELVRLYYAKADKQGRALRRRVLTKPAQRALVAYFGGDWLSFLDYLGEGPHPDEDVVMSLPKVHLFIDTKPVAEVATAAGVAPAEAEAVLASFFRTSARQVSSPVEERLRVLRNYWSIFDSLHARQAEGMPSLWGLVDTNGQYLDGNDPSGTGPGYGPTRYLRLLPAEVLGDVERLWNCIVLPKVPDRMVMSVSPHELLAQAFGPALAFWHGVGLTLWFITQGPYSRTDLTHLDEYYGAEAAGMGALGAPLPHGFFREMTAANNVLGPPEEVMEPLHRSSADGVELTMSIGRGSRRAGFEKVRDIVTDFRRKWAADHLAGYLQHVSENEITQAVHLHQRLATERGKPPTLKSFARHAVGSANHWFGGNLADLYGAFGEKSPVNPKLVAYPLDRLRFVETTYRGFGGTHTRKDYEDRTHWLAVRLANESLHFLQLEQALGRAPTVQEFGVASIEYYARDTNSDPVDVWTWYQQVIAWAKALTGLPTSPPPIAS